MRGGLDSRSDEDSNLECGGEGSGTSVRCIFSLHRWKHRTRVLSYASSIASTTLGVRELSQRDDSMYTAEDLLHRQRSDARRRAVGERILWND
ncbi:hypothetical protein Tco_0804219 [Tanacetum coccineum]|uniref:Uncharacterized protein n=1 Tax=Tanacetum coccineum TaxID=301880 RepID=A0ABQ5A6I5_9ASTR